MKIDKRIIKTKANIKNALLELAQNKKVEDITVSELTSHAKVNRSTFYLHYGSVGDVLEDVENEMAIKIADNIGNYDLNDIYGSTYKALVKLSSALDGIPNLKKCIVFSDNSPSIIVKLKNIITDRIKDAVLSEFPHLSGKDVIYPLTFVSAGIIESYLKWVRNNEEIPIEELISEVGNITVQILKCVINK